MPIEGSFLAVQRHEMVCAPEESLSSPSLEIQTYVPH
jgi:hypothetical protein